MGIAIGIGICIGELTISPLIFIIIISNLDIIVLAEQFPIEC